MSDLASINISLETFAVIISMIFLGGLFISDTKNTKLGRLFIRLLICNTIVLVCDISSWYLEGSTSLYARPIIWAASFGVITLCFPVAAIFNDYFITYISTKARISGKITYIIYGACIIAVLIITVAQINDRCFYIDINNHYQRNDLFWIPYVGPAATFFIDTMLLFRYRDSLGREDSLALLLYEILPLIAMIIQFKFGGIILTYAANTAACLIIYMRIQVEQSKRLKEKELELSNYRIDIMLSQISPHFLYNSLVAIKELCHINPETASEAVGEFSNYLRGNLDSLSLKLPIPFEKELKHVENYLALEKKRFGDKLTIVYGITAQDFQLPALTLQPIVENAVRHGVTKREDGGTVTIQTMENELNIVIAVTDDGVGFDSSQPKQDGRSHIGIENVRNRLAAMCGGALSIQSTPGVGTTAVITIPKGGFVL